MQGKVIVETIHEDLVYLDDDYRLYLHWWGSIVDNLIIKVKTDHIGRVRIVVDYGYSKNVKDELHRVIGVDLTYAFLVDVIWVT